MGSALPSGWAPSAVGGCAASWPGPRCSVWTEATGKAPSAAWTLVTQPDARAGIVEATLARSDSAWAGAIVAEVWHPRLVALLPPAERDALGTRQLASAAPAQVVPVVRAMPAPWGPAFSRAVLERLQAEKDPALLVAQLTSDLALGLDPLARPALDTWAARLDSAPRERVLRISQYLALINEIPEAFR